MNECTKRRVDAYTARLKPSHTCIVLLHKSKAAVRYEHKKLHYRTDCIARFVVMIRFSVTSAVTRVRYVRNRNSARNKKNFRRANFFDTLRVHLRGVLRCVKDRRTFKRNEDRVQELYNGDWHAAV